MKKLLILLTVAIVSSSSIYAAENVIPIKQNDKTQAMNIRLQRENAFEKRLGLTEEQKVKAKEIRKNGHEKLRPVIEEIKLKKQEAKMVKMSRIAVEVQEERLAVIDSELKILEKKANEIRKSNMKEFESILTRNQKRILKQMKKEGRKRYHETHPSLRPVMSTQKMFSK